MLTLVYVRIKMSGPRCLNLHVVLETLVGFNLHVTRPRSAVSSRLLSAQIQATDTPRSDTRGGNEWDFVR